MSDLIELLRDRAKDAGGDKLLEEAAAALEAAREDALDAARYRFIRGQHAGPWVGADRKEYPTLDDATDAAIDQARGKGVAK